MDIYYQIKYKKRKKKINVIFDVYHLKIKNKYKKIPSINFGYISLKKKSSNVLFHQIGAKS